MGDTIRYPLCEVTDSLSSLKVICCAFSDLLSWVGAFSCTNRSLSRSLLAQHSIMGPDWHHWPYQYRTVPDLR